MNKYELTLEQIHEIICRYKQGYFCENNCYGCCGDNSLSTHCKRCNPKLIEYLEIITEAKQDEKLD